MVILGEYRDGTPILENQIEKNMENEMETWINMGNISSGYIGDISK